MKERERRLQRMRAVEREFTTAAVAIEALGKRLRGEQSALAEFSLTQRDFHALRRNLEGTYLVRLFAEFETGLRSAWVRAFRRRSHPQMRDLLNAIAGRRSVSQRWLDAVHEVRMYRNSLVHDDSEQAAPIAIEEARDRLCRFFSQLPVDW